jgi:hypothetical protein
MARHEHKVARSHLERQESSARRSALRVREAAKKAVASYATAGRNKPALLDERRRGARRRSACRAEGNPGSESCLTGSIATKPAGSRTAGFLFFRRLRNAIQVRTPGCRNGQAAAAVGSRHQSSAGLRAAFPPIPTRSNASWLLLSFMKTLPPRARSAPFVPLCPEIPDLLEMQDRRFAFSDDCRALTLLGRQYHRSHYC